MPTYNFKTICVVPGAKDFIDIILSKTQRQTPTVIRKGYKISRIRSFYIRKCKFAQQNYHEKLTVIVDEFPRLEDIHPFYADLLNVLYSRDHYKLALGHINKAKKLVDGIGKDYVRLLKFGDSLYRCKQLKRAALGRMCTIVKKLDASLKYLEQVRQHLSRLPAIDPNTRTLMITGYPNVGKSSFVNKISRANVEVQPYPFTTKSLFVGHTDYQYNRWQVVDTPGILDHPLEDRNTIEMQAVTALAHLHSTVLFFVDISEQCGYPIKQQVALYHSIKPLFTNKPLLVVANKIDLKKFEDVPAEDRALLESISKDRDTSIIQMSNATEEGIVTVKEKACELLLMDRYEKKIKGKKMESVINRIHIATPTPRDDKDRPLDIPEAVLEEKKNRKKIKSLPKLRKLKVKEKKQLEEDSENTEMSDVTKRKTERDLEIEAGGPGIYNYDLRKNYLLDNPDWKYDEYPEIIDGMNLFDYIDPDIGRKLADLEKEEAQLVKEWQDEEAMLKGHDDVEEDEKELADWITKKRKEIKDTNDLRKPNNKPPVPRKFKTQSVSDAENKLQEVGLDTSKFRSTSLAKSRKRRRSVGPKPTEGEGDVQMELVPGTGQVRAQSAGRSKSRNRTPSIGPGTGFSDMKVKQKAAKMARVAQRAMNQEARQGESDRRFLQKKPKHLFSGKRGIGKTDRR